MRLLSCAAVCLTLLTPALARGQELSVRASFGAPPAAEKVLAKIAEPTILTIAAGEDPIARARSLCGRITPTYLDLLRQANPHDKLAPEQADRPLTLPACLYLRPETSRTQLPEESLADFASRVIGSAGPQTLARLRKDNTGVSPEAPGEETALNVRFSTKPAVYKLRGEAAADPEAAARALAQAIGGDAPASPDTVATPGAGELIPATGPFIRKAVACDLSVTPVSDANWPFNIDAMLAALERNRVTRLALGMGAAEPVVVALADNGVDRIGGADFPPGVLKVNGGETPNNKKDDEQNGYVDDVIGVSLFQLAVAPGPTPLGAIIQREHGTQMASLILGGPDFRAKAPATADRVRLLVINMVEHRVESINYANVEHWGYPGKGLVEAVRFARARGASVLNLSVGTEEMLTDFEDQARKDDQLVIVAAAGNRATQYRDVSFYPASYGGEASRVPGRFITVGASDRRGCLADFSGRGARTVDVLAPGVGIRAISLEGKSETLDGTSQATALVTFIVALLQSEGTMSPQAIRDRLFATVDQRPDLADYVASGGIINPVRAVNILNDIILRKGDTDDSYARFDQDIRIQDVCDDADARATGRVLRVERRAGAKPLRVTWRKDGGSRDTFDCKPPDEARKFSYKAGATPGTLTLADVSLLIPR